MVRLIPKLLFSDRGRGSDTQEPAWMNDPFFSHVSKRFDYLMGYAQWGVVPAWIKIKVRAGPGSASKLLRGSGHIEVRDETLIESQVPAERQAGP
jgi:hypothetical protein